jgi:hypothetical protein
MLTRRELLATTAAALVAAPRDVSVQTPAVASVTEKQKGDPDWQYESVTFDPDKIRDLSSGRADFKPYKAALPSAMLSIASGFVGKSRATTPEEIAQFLKLFHLDLKDAKGEYVPYCAAGLSFCAVRAYATQLNLSFNIANQLEIFRRLAGDIEHYYFYPSVSCQDMKYAAQSKRHWVDHKTDPAKQPKRGWIVLFEWEKPGMVDHCGIVESVTANGLTTIEFNTTTGTGSNRNGGTVASKHRDYAHVAGFIVTDAQPRDI